MTVEQYIKSNPVCFVNIIRQDNRQLFRTEVLFDEILEDNPSITADELASALRDKGSLTLVPGKAWIDVKPSMIDYSHGMAYDRGSADSWYHRPRSPHWYPSGAYNGKEIGVDEMTPQQIAAYHAGYTWQLANLNELRGGP